MANPKLTIVIPVRNEGQNLRLTLRILNALVDAPHEVLVVYDTPQDGSIGAIQEMKKRFPNVNGIQNSLGPGVINAVRAGAAAAKGEYILVMAADDFGPVLSIPQIIALMDSGCELVSATRYSHGGRVIGGSLASRLFSRLVNLSFGILSGTKMTDLTVGIKAFRPALLGKIPLSSNPVGWAFAFELAIKSGLLGIRVGEAPIISLNRLYSGRSSFSASSWAGEYFRWFAWGIWQMRTKGIPGNSVMRPPQTQF